MVELYQIGITLPSGASVGGMDKFPVIYQAPRLGVGQKCWHH